MKIEASIGGEYGIIGRRILMDRAMNPTDKLIIAYLRTYGNEEVFPKQETIAKDLDLTVPTVSRSLSRIAAAGWIVKMKSGHGNGLAYDFSAPEWWVKQNAEYNDKLASRSKSNLRLGASQTCAQEQVQESPKLPKRPTGSDLKADSSSPSNTTSNISEEYSPPSGVRKKAKYQVDLEEYAKLKGWFERIDSLPPADKTKWFKKHNRYYTEIKRHADVVGVDPMEVIRAFLAAPVGRWPFDRPSEERVIRTLQDERVVAASVTFVAGSAKALGLVRKWHDEGLTIQEINRRVEEEHRFGRLTAQQRDDGIAVAKKYSS